MAFHHPPPRDPVRCRHGPAEGHDSAVSVRLLAKAARRASEDGEQRRLTITEMLPDLDQLWLPDADGELYTAELRLVAVDRQPPRGGGR